MTVRGKAVKRQCKDRERQGNDNARTAKGSETTAQGTVKGRESHSTETMRGRETYSPKCIVRQHLTTTSRCRRRRRRAGVQRRCEHREDYPPVFSETVK